MAVEALARRPPLSRLARRHARSTASVALLIAVLLPFAWMVQMAFRPAADALELSLAFSPTLEAFAEANRSTGATTLIITHNATIQQIADRTLRFADGRIVDEITNLTRKRPDQMSW
mgnify:CR=1 FL=1